MNAATSPSAFVIAEGGVNHNGDVALAFRLIDAAIAAGADAIKFQHFKPQMLARPDAGMATYQRRNTQRDQSQIDMLSGLTLTSEALQSIAAYAAEKNIGFLCTPFDAQSAKEIADLVPAWKVSSTDLTNFPFLRDLAAFKKPLLLSTGMATLDEVEAAVDFCKPLVTRSDVFPALTILHCVSAYPAPIDETNLLVIPELRDRLGVPIGFSDHSMGIGAAIGAAALGATVIEKHMTLDVNMPGPDHMASLEPEQFRALVMAVRDASLARGVPEKSPQASETEHRKTVRRSLHAARDIASGAIIDTEDLIALRPADGLSPMEFDNIIGMRAVTDIAKGQLISYADLQSPSASDSGVADGT